MSINLKARHRRVLGLLFTQGMSLKDWDTLGTLQFEIKRYHYFLKKIDEIRIFTYGTLEDKKYEKMLGEGFKIYPLNMRISNFIATLILPLYFYRELSGCDVIKSNQMLGAWAGTIFGLINRKKKIVVRTGYLLSKSLPREFIQLFRTSFLTLLERFAYTFCNTVIVSSFEDKDFIHNRYGIDNYRINVIQNSIDTDVFKPIPVQNKRDILFVGRLHKEKNLEFLFRAISKMKVTVTIIGKGENRDNLHILASQNKMDVNFIEKVENDKLPNYYNSHKLFVLPSLYEGMPKVLLEAMACGMAVIGANVKGIKEVLADPRNGLLLEHDEKEFSDAIEGLLKNPSECEKFGRAARLEIESVYSNRILYKKELEILTELVN